jgi:hypothetical protein
VTLLYSSLQQLQHGSTVELLCCWQSAQLKEGVDCVRCCSIQKQLDDSFTAEKRCCW